MSTDKRTAVAETQSKPPIEWPFPAHVIPLHKKPHPHQIILQDLPLFDKNRLCQPGDDDVITLSAVVGNGGAPWPGCHTIPSSTSGDCDCDSYPQRDPSAAAVIGALAHALQFIGDQQLPRRSGDRPQNLIEAHRTFFPAPIKPCRRGHNLQVR